MTVGVELDGQRELLDRLARAHDGILTLTDDVSAQADNGPLMLAFDSATMRARTWGTEQLWQLPRGAWVAPRVQLPEQVESTLTEHVQQLLD